MATVLGIIDVQCGFFPADEGTRLGKPGFGELGVTDAPAIVPLLNHLMAHATQHSLRVFYTQDWHPRSSAHFAPNPNYTTNWPVHCVADTPGAAMHPDVALPDGAVRIVKGTEELRDGADDTSYSAWNGHTPAGATLEAVLREQHVDTVVLAGLATDYCVGHTALDLAQKGNFRVVVVEPATRPVAAASAATMRARLVAAGVGLIDVAAAEALLAGGAR